VIDGCPAGLPLSEADICGALKRRAPGQNHLVSPRRENDLAEILSGVFEGMTTGAPISILIPNIDADSSRYEPIKDMLRPGHAQFGYIEKYGVFDHRGGGRASGRETACRVAAGAVAQKLLAHFGITCSAYLAQVGDAMEEAVMVAKIEEAQAAGDSLGGIVAFRAENLPAGLGDPVYEKLEANLAKALLSIPATKGFEIGSGFRAVSMAGSAHNDHFVPVGITATNHAGGTLGGISTGMPLEGRVVFKPTSSIRIPQPTIGFDGSLQTFTLPEGSRHDPCVAVRAVVVVEAMVALVLADALLLNRLARV